MATNRDDRELWERLARALDTTQTLVRSHRAGWKDTLSSVDETSTSVKHLEKLCREAERRALLETAKLEALESELSRLRATNATSLRDVQKLAYQDPLTGLANLNLLQEHLDKLPSPDRPQPQTALFILDIDRFYEMNQILGVEAGDSILVRLADRLSQITGPNEVLARRGQDEFVVVFSNLEMNGLKEKISDLSSILINLTQRPFLFDGQKFEISVTIGASHYPDSATSPSELIQQAERALAFAKRQGRSQFRLYDQNLGAIIRRESRIEFEMRNALECKEFSLNYLPIVAFEKEGGSLLGHLVGVEALVRWNHRTEGPLAPESFLPFAERNGFVVALGHWVIQSVCSQLESWSAAGLSLYAMVNLSGRELLQLGLSDTICRLVDRHGVSRQNLLFEIQETWSSLDEEHIDQSIHDLRKAGFSIAIDKFGTRHSSPRCLSQARFLKLSQHLLEASHHDRLRAAFSVAEGLQISPISVGIESEQQLRNVFHLGCRVFQGHLLSPDVHAQQVQVLARQLWRYRTE